MVFGYMVVRALLPLVRLVGRLPGRVGTVFAAVLDLAARPFHVVNYLGSCAAALVFNRRRMQGQMDRVIASAPVPTGAQTASCSAGMPFPVRWDPFFRPWMSLQDVPLRHAALRLPPCAALVRHAAASWAARLTAPPHPSPPSS